MEKKKQNSIFVPLESLEHELVEDRVDLREEIDQEFLLEDWKEILETLPVGEELVIWNYFFKGKTIKEIAKKYRLKKQQVKDTKKLALKKLKNPYRMNMMKDLDIPLKATWSSKGNLKRFKITIPKKPECVKLKIEKGIPSLKFPPKNILEIEPITLETYGYWLNEVIEEYETGT